MTHLTAVLALFPTNTNVLCIFLACFNCFYRQGIHTNRNMTNLNCAQVGLHLFKMRGMRLKSLHTKFMQSHLKLVQKWQATASMPYNAQCDKERGHGPYAQCTLASPFIYIFINRRYLIRTQFCQIVVRVRANLRVRVRNCCSISPKFTLNQKTNKQKYRKARLKGII